MNIQSQLRSALLCYFESGDATEFCNLTSSHPEIIATDYGEYPDMHRLMDLRVGERNFRVCRQISRGEMISLVPIEELFNTPGVPLWLTGEKLALWAANEEKNPSDEPTDWNQYR